MDTLLEFLREEVDEFDWAVCKLQASDYLLPQQRCRVFLRGLRASIGKVPDPLPAFGHQELANILDPKLPSVDWKSLTPTMATNLKDGVAFLQEMLSDGKAEATDIFVFPLDRAAGKSLQEILHQEHSSDTDHHKQIFIFGFRWILTKGNNNESISGFWIHPSLFLNLFYFYFFSIFHTMLLNGKRHPKNKETVQLYKVELFGTLALIHGKDGLGEDGKTHTKERMVLQGFPATIFKRCQCSPAGASIWECIPGAPHHCCGSPHAQHGWTDFES